MSMSKTVLYCKICGKEISALGMPSHLNRKHGLSGKEYYEKYCSKKEYDGVCKICGKPTTFKSIEYGYRTFCSSKCANRDSDVLAKHAATVLERYGPEGLACKEIRDKTKATNLRKYGVEHTLQLPHIREQMLESTWTEETRAKRCTTNIERYGTACVFSSKIVQDKIASTNLEKYGSENVFGSKIIQNKIAATNLERYGNENVLSSETIKAKIHSTMTERYGGMSC